MRLQFRVLFVLFQFDSACCLTGQAALGGGFASLDSRVDWQRSKSTQNACFGTDAN